MSISTFLRHRRTTITAATAGDGQASPDQLNRHDEGFYEDMLCKEIRVKCAGCGHQSRVIVPKKTRALPLCPYCMRKFLEVL